MSDQQSRETAPHSTYRDELDSLVEALDSLGRGEGRLAQIAGDPGTGKTRLIAVLVREAAARNIEALVGRCAEAESGRDLYPFVEVLSSGPARGLLDDLPAEWAHLLRTLFPASSSGADAPAVSDVDRVRLHYAIRMFLERCAEKGMLVVLDDFHHADRRSVEFLDHLVRFPVPGLFLVVAHRPRQTSAGLRGTFAHGVEMGTVQRVRLGSISVDQAAEILGMAPDDPELRRLHAESDGVPAHLLALSPAGDAADRYTDRLLAEVDGSSGDERTVLRAAAIIGDRFDLDTAAAVAGMPGRVVEAALSGLVARDLIRGAGPPYEYAFRHPTVRAAVLREAGPGWQRDAHRRCLRTLVDRNADVGDMRAHVLRLLEKPHPDDVALLSRAAELAIAADPAMAVRWLQSLSEALPDGGRGTAGHRGIRLQLARALAADGQITWSRDVYREVLPLLPLEDREARISATLHCAQLESVLRGHGEAGGLVQEELKRTPADTSAEYLRLEQACAFFGAMGDHAASYDLAEHCLEQARSHGDRLDQAGALIALARGRLLEGAVGSAVQAVDACVPVIDRLSETELGRNIEYLTALGWLELYLDRPADAERHFLRGGMLALLHGHPHDSSLAMLGLASMYFHTGRLNMAMHAATEAKWTAQQIGAVYVESLAAAHQTAFVVAMEGGAKSALIDLEDCSLVSVPTDFGYARTSAVVVLGETLLEGGDPERCQAMMLSLGGGPSLAAVPLVERIPYLEMLTLAAVATGTGSPGEWAETAAQLARRTGLGSHQALATAAQAHVVRATGDHRRALYGYRAAALVFAELGDDLAQARMAALAARAALDAGLPDEAAPLLASLREIARRSRARRLEDQARAMQFELTRPAPGPAPAGPGGGLSLLTAREAEIARLAGSGERTKDIATRLSLSPRTVETHLAHVYAKLSVKSRAQLANWIAEHGRFAGPADGPPAGDTG